MEEDLQRAVEVMSQGGTILYPTDTIWGIGCDATNSEAVAKVFALKKRVDSKALIVLVDRDVKVDFYVDTPPEIAWELIAVSDKPLTLIYPQARNLSPKVISPEGNVAIRVTKEAFSHKLCERFRKAIVSTSANVSGTPPPATFADISPEIIAGVDYVVKYRQDDRQPATPSSIIAVGSGGLINVIRP